MPPLAGCTAGCAAARKLGQRTLSLRSVPCRRSQKEVKWPKLQWKCSWRRPAPSAPPHARRTKGLLKASPRPPLAHLVVLVVEARGGVPGQDRVQVDLAPALIPAALAR